MKRLVHIDDNEMILEVISSMFDGEEVEVVSFDNPILALKYLSENLHNIDLVVSDINMPEMNGLDLFSRAIANMTKIPNWFFFSGHTDFENGFDDEIKSRCKIFSKPDLGIISEIRNTLFVD